MLVGQPCIPDKEWAAEGPVDLEGVLPGRSRSISTPPSHVSNGDAHAHLRLRHPHRLRLVSAQLLPQFWTAQFYAAEWRAPQRCLQLRQMTVA